MCARHLDYEDRCPLGQRGICQNSRQNKQASAVKKTGAYRLLVAWTLIRPLCFIAPAPPGRRDGDDGKTDEGGLTAGNVDCINAIPA